MSDDLISRQHLLNRIRYYVSHTNNGSPENYAYNIALNEIIQAPKAFDKEKVIEELKANMSSVQGISGQAVTFMFSDGYYNGIKDAIEIVEKGGGE